MKNSFVIINKLRRFWNENLKEDYAELLLYVEVIFETVYGTNSENIDIYASNNEKLYLQI